METVRPHKGLSARLLLLTVLFVMLAEVMIYAPSIARYRKVYLEERLTAAHLAVLALEATPDGMVDTDLQRRLLLHAEALAIKIKTKGGEMRMLGAVPYDTHAAYDLSHRTFYGLIADALQTLVRDGDQMIWAQGPSPKSPDVWIEALVREDPLRAQMWDYSRRIMMLSLGISIFTAALVYISLHRLMVRPIRQMTASVQAFRAHPEDARHTLETSERSDEIGIAERALSEMQVDLRKSLTQQARLAGTGTAVAKVAHDLRGILSVAMLEMDRLEAKADSDPEVQTITEGIVSALDRAVALCAETVKFAKEGAPTVALSHFDIADLALLSIAPLATKYPETEWDVAVPNELCVEADWDLMSRVLTNLLENAALAGAETVVVTAEANTAGGVDILLTDDGPGLAIKAIDHLFEPFAGSARKGGSGLGLPIARELMAAQGGRIELMRTGTNGTVFKLVLPTKVMMGGMS